MAPPLKEPLWFAVKEADGSYIVVRVRDYDGYPPAPCIEGKLVIRKG